MQWSPPKLPPSSLWATPPEPHIVLVWLIRLRWLAVAGQLAAIAVATEFLELDLPLWPMCGVILLTALTNLLLLYWRPGRISRPPSAPRPLIPAVLILDVCLLTALLYFSGGPTNPFSILYLVHVAMAVVVLGSGWVWVIVAAAALCYGLLFWFHEPLPARGPFHDVAFAAGSWLALALVAALIALFIGRIARALRKRERELAAVRELIGRNEQLAALATLAAGAAHELGTPLGTIAVVAKEIELEMATRPGGDPMADDARLIRSEIERCRAILARLRVESHDDLSQRPAAMHVSELLGDLCADLKAERAANLRIHCAPDVDVVMVPRRALLQALHVLIANAFDASAPGQVVTLSITRRAGHIRFEVIDSGQGMEDTVLRRAGEPFFTTKPPGLGMGLGLFLVRLVAEKNEGLLQIRSEKGRGTSAVLSLPEEPFWQPAEGPGKAPSENEGNQL